MRRLKIDLSDLAEAFDNVSPDLNYFLDLESGERDERLRERVLEWLAEEEIEVVEE